MADAAAEDGAGADDEPSAGAEDCTAEAEAEADWPCTPAASARVRREARVVNEGMVGAIRWLGKSVLTWRVLIEGGGSKRLGEAVYAGCKGEFVESGHGQITVRVGES